MRPSPKLTFIGLLALAAAAVAGLILTGSSLRSPVGSVNPRSSAASQETDVDQKPLDTARQLSTLAATAEEQGLAQDAVRVADHEVDLAFASALRTASQQPAVRNAQTRAVQQRVNQLQAELQADQEKISLLTAQAKKAKSDRQEELQQQIEVIQAEVALDQDDLADAQQDLTRAGGNARSRLQQLLEEHDAAEHLNGSVRLDAGSGGGATPAASPPAGSFIAKCRDWNALRAKQDQLLEAGRDALGRAAALSRSHDALEKQVSQEQPQKKALARQAAEEAATGQEQGSSNAKNTAAAVVTTLHQLSEDKKNLADLDRRIEDLQHLGASYGEWSLLVKAQELLALHNIIRSALLIILALLALFLAHRVIDRFLARLGLERKRQATLRAILRFAVQTLAVLVILLVVFGIPSQLSTILGLAGAGLTVVLKDFIVSFLGWFALMGRNGIRVGDWVEINGVRGEVIEISLLRTVLLETGNWSEGGYPTGRQVAFLNSYAVEGYYFNFTTAGQWLWDELQVLIPSGEDPYPLIEKVRAIVAKETENSVQAAEQEWQRVTRRYGVRSLSAAPAVDVRPADGGVKLVVRYMTRAGERSEVRSRLSHAVVEMLHHGKEAASITEAQPVLGGS
jgi:small-conductance mechanosensitive channel